MPKLKARLSIGYPTAVRKTEVDTEADWGFTDEEWAEMTEEQKLEEVMQWAWNFIEVDWEES